MFGLPMTTTLILGGVMAFWVVYTLVFYFSTANWSIEDADYAGGQDPDVSGHTDGVQQPGGDLR